MHQGVIHHKGKNRLLWFTYNIQWRRLWSLIFCFCLGAPDTSSSPTVHGFPKVSSPSAVARFGEPESCDGVLFGSTTGSTEILFGTKTQLGYGQWFPTDVNDAPSAATIRLENTCLIVFRTTFRRSTGRIHRQRRRYRRHVGRRGGGRCRRGVGR